MTTLLMHETTYNWLKANLDQASKIGNVAFNGYEISIYGVRIETCSWLKPTINETNDYVFPKERFVTYQDKDIDWCEPLGIGRWGRGFILGEVYKINGNNERFPIKIDLTPKKRAVVWNPFS